METSIEIPDLSQLRRYSLAELDDIDFSTSDDFAIVVENLKGIITLGKSIEECWTDNHEQLLWEFVIDETQNLLVAYFSGKALHLQFSLPKSEVSDIFYFLRNSNEQLKSADFLSNLMYGTAKFPFFESLYKTIVKVYAPMFLESDEWPICIKSDYANQISDFVSELVEVKRKLKGELLLFVPEKVLKNSIEAAVENKELLNKVERAVMKWIRLLSGILTVQESDAFVSGGPLDEIKRWEDKLAELEKILERLKEEDVKKCVEILKTAKLLSYHKFMEVTVLLQDEFNVASENIKFLSILGSTCEEIQNSDLINIPQHLTELLSLVWIIWNNSPYFNNNSKISNLICKVNNFVTQVVSKFIPLDNILSVESSGQEQSMITVISVCNQWIQIFNQFEKMHEKYSEKTWSVDSVSTMMNL